MASIKKDRSKEEKAFDFFKARLKAKKPFTLRDLAKHCGWKESTPKTYLKKHWEGLIEKSTPGKFIVKSEFGRMTLPEFLGQGTQVKPIFSQYERRKHEHVIAYEFLLPLTQEDRLRRALDDLFFKDTIKHRLREIGIAVVASFMGREPQESDAALVKRTLKFTEDKIGGYSISHVSGRFRASGLRDRSRVKVGEPYLIDETTAVVRFIIPCTAGRTPYAHTPDGIAEALNNDEPRTKALKTELRQVRGLFHHLFVEAVTRTVPEQEVWLLEESPYGRRLYVWARA